ncbi:MAG: hypothetical protein JW902_16925 [Syntrophaceae bacterium]|nr:hypothetical protein [Syntrophaceae bacterium]
MARLTIPGVGSLRIAWYEYGDRYSPQLKIRFNPTKDVKAQIARVNRIEYQKWKAARVPGTERTRNNG